MKQIENTEYFICEIGNVYSNKNKELKLMKTHITSHGYVAIRLMINKKSQLKYIHRLLAESYIENIYNKPCVNHKDGNKQNNSLINLEWVTYSENNKNAFDTGLKLPSKNVVGKKISIISKCGLFYKTFKSRKDLALFLNIDKRRVSDFFYNKKQHSLYNFI